MNRRQVLTLLAGGAASTIAGCGSQGDGTPRPTDATTRTGSDRRGLSLGDGFRMDSGKSVQIEALSIQHAVTWDGYDPFFLAASGQFLRIHASIEIAATPGRYESLSRANLQFYGHPTPSPQPFAPSLVVELDDTRYEPEPSTITRPGVPIIVDVPVQRVSNGRIRWTDPDPPVTWEIPDRVLAGLQQAPTFVRHSVSVSASNPTAIRADIENVGSVSGTYRYLVSTSPPAHSHGGAQAREETIPPETRDQFHHELHWPDTFDRQATDVTFQDGQMTRTVVHTPPED